MDSKYERRALALPFEASGDGNKLVGYAAVYDVPARVTDLVNGRVKTFMEVVRAGSFDKALRAVASNAADVYATFNHSDRLLGRTSSGTLRLSSDGKGLRYEIDLPQTAADIKELVGRGDLWGSSFSFAPRGQGGDKWTGQTQELLDLMLFELGPVINPAYGRATTAGLRSLDGYRRQLDLLKISLAPARYTQR